MTQHGSAIREYLTAKFTFVWLRTVRLKRLNIESSFLELTLFPLLEKNPLSCLVIVKDKASC